MPTTTAVPERLPGGTGAPPALGGGAVLPDQTTVTLNAYQNYTRPREFLQPE